MSVRIIVGDALDQLRLLPADSVHCCVTSPPYYGLRDYGCAGQIGLEPSPDEYVTALVAVFREVRRVLRQDGTLWVNIADSYSSGGRDTYGPVVAGTKQATQPAIKSAKRPPAIAGIKPKDLLGIPWMLAFALRADGWWLRQDIVWSKRNPMPESVSDRCTKAHEYLFLLSKSERYWFDAAAIAERAVDPPGHHRGGSLARIGADIFVAANAHRGPPSLSDGTRNKRSVWTVASEPFAEAHFACFPPRADRARHPGRMPKRRNRARPVRRRRHDRPCRRPARPQRHPDRTQPALCRHVGTPHLPRRPAIRRCRNPDDGATRCRRMKW